MNKDILISDVMQIGLWPDDNPNLSIEDARLRMFGFVASLFPVKPSKILIVGVGNGLLIKHLVTMNHHVVAIDLSQEAISGAQQTCLDYSVELRLLGIIDHDDRVFLPNFYDIVFFNGSIMQSQPIIDVINRARFLLKDKGLIIIANEVCYYKKKESDGTYLSNSELSTALCESGFCITKNIKISKEVLSTWLYIILEQSDVLKTYSEKDTINSRLKMFHDYLRSQYKLYKSGLFGYEIFTARKEDFYIRSYKNNDEERIILMFNEIFSTKRTMSHWDWKFRNNPYGAHNIAVAINFDDDICAHYAGYPVPFYSLVGPSKYFLSLQIGDTMTIPSVRTVGLGKTGLLARTAHYFYGKFCDGLVPFIYGFNTSNIKKLGMRYLNYVYIDPVVIWRRNIRVNPFIHEGLFSRLFSGYLVEEVNSVSREWDELFERVCTEYVLLVKRNAEYVRWRYMECPDKCHRVFSISKYGRLIGWGVFTKSGSTVVWGDALFDRSFSNAVSTFLYRVISNWFYDSEVIEAWFSQNPKWWIQTIRANGFMPEKEPNDLAPGFVIFGDTSLLNKLSSHFYYTKGDSDLF